MFKFAFLSFMVIGLTLQACDKGCLKCNAKNECVFCDSFNGYYLSGTNCATSTQTNCALLAQNGDCATCNANFYVDNGTKKCVAVDAAKLVTNCLSYSGSQSCLRCAKNFLVKDGKCIAVTKLVDNCDWYSADGVCASCASGFIFNATRDACVASPNTANCSAYSFVGCKTCATGYIANQNLYFTDFGLNSSNILAQILASTTAANDWVNLRLCQKLADANCLVASAYNVCTTCMPGYFLTAAKTCRAFPLPIIEGCLAYSSLITCRQCQVGYYLESNVKCTLISADKLITDCQTYDNKASSVVCTLCAATKFLSANTCTSLRKDSLNMAQCKTTTIAADTCDACNDGYTLTTDQKACLASIANCLTYTTSSMTTTTLTCQTCKNTFYLSTTNSVTTCIAGAIDGCMTYSSATTCTLCNPNGYYLNAGTCTKHVNVDNCVAYHASSFNQCATCATGFFPFQLSQTCNAITPVSKCTAYNADFTCNACATGYYITTAKTCVALSTLANCSAATTAGVCTTCLDGFAFYSTANTCSAEHDYIATNCATLASSTTLANPTALTFKNWATADTASCSVCKENTEPMDIGKTFQCVLNERLVTKGISGNTLIANCKRYGDVGGAPVCFQCVSPKKLNLAAGPVYSCVDACPALSTHYADMLDGRVDVCILMADTNDKGIADCAEATVNANGANFDYKCIGIGNSKYNLIDFATTEDVSLAWDISGSTILQPTGNIFYRGFTVAAVAVGTIVGGAAITNCELYASIADPGTGAAVTACVRCKWTFSAKVTVAGGAATSSCVAITDCNATSSLSGFGVLGNKFLSCHSCNNSKVLVLSHSADLANNSNVPNGLIPGVNAVECVATNDARIAVIANCAVYYHQNVIANNSGSALKKCLACSPGYTQTGALVATTSATCNANAITDCDTTTSNFYVNRCGACTQGTGASGPFRAFGDNTMTTCLTVNTANCLIASATVANNVNVCATCKAGYILNKDNNCTKYTFAKCGESSANKLILSTVSDVNIAAYYMVKKQTTVSHLAGCDNCNAGYTPIYLPATEMQCVGSDYVTANTYATSTVYVADCARYKNTIDANGNTLFVCWSCKNNKTVTNNGKLCADTVANCKTAQDNPNQAKCLTCIDTYVNVNGSCALKNIANCSVWGDSSALTDQICGTCADGFYLTDAKKCLAGNVAFCKSYNSNSATVCNACLTGYSLLNTANSGTYCIKINSGSNCLSLEQASLQTSAYKCTLCSVSDSAAFYTKTYSTFANQNTLPQSICLALNPVEKCTAYDVASATASSNSFLCTACADGFFLNTDKNLCVQRTNMPAGCTKYYVNADKCLTCNDSTFKNVLETDCVSFPNGILGCATYSNDTVCTTCNAPRFLSNNTCQLSTVISKCASYSANYTCTSCESSYFLTNSTFCELAKATFCYTYSSISACATCDPANLNKGLKTDTNGVTSCVDKNVPNCDISTNVFPFKCTQCKKGFYLAADGTCTAATNINKCLIYDSATTCTLCDTTAVLATDRKTCNDTYFAAFADPFCADNQQQSTAVCAKCSPGYVFANSTCTACGNNTYGAGCFSCDPTNQTMCFACRPGYFQSANGACQPNAVVPANNTNGTTTSAVIAKAFALLALLFAILA